MTTVKISHVISCSSEDPNFPAENLTLPDTYKKWKCKTAGEKQASVILQLEKASVISSIDIGNEHSAFVEVLVGRSISPDEFQVIVVASSFMSPLESKNGTQTNRVRIFGPNELTKPTCHEKWDRVKLVCTQPFNRNVQYGLSFVTLHLLEAKDEEKGRKVGGELGRFTVRDDDEEEVIPVGSLFARRKEKTAEPLTGAAAIRDASSPATIMKNSLVPPSKPMDKVKTLIDKRDSASPSGTSKPVEKKAHQSDRAKTSREKASPSRGHGDSSKPSDRKVNDRRRSPGEKGNGDNAKQAERNKREKTNDKPTKRPSQSNSPAPPAKKTKPTKPKQKRPFGKLLDGVVFVLSGYQNPYRQKLRDKALEMGAKYKPDWCDGCTHLICAFPNTPKFQQVQGKGKIVSKQWIDDCYSDRKHLPWRRYALDRNDQGKDESDEEIHEDIPSPDSNVVSDDDDDVNRLTVSSEQKDDSGSDTEDEIERVKMISLKEAEEKKRLEKNKQRIVDEEKAKEENRCEREAVLKVKEVDDDGDETDNDENDNRPDTSKLSLPYLPDFFKDKTFYLHDELASDVKTQLNRYIVAYKGTVLSDLGDGHTDYLVADDDTNIKKVISKYPETVAVTPDWVWKCNDAEKCLSTSPYEIK